MVNFCCVKSCKNEAYPGSRFSFHSFPKNPYYRAMWAKAVQHNRGVVCSKHFLSDDYVQNCWVKNRRLVKNAVPSQLLPTQSCDDSWSQHHVGSRSPLLEISETSQIKIETHNSESADSYLGNKKVLCIQPIKNYHGRQKLQIKVENVVKSSTLAEESKDDLKVTWDGNDKPFNYDGNDNDENDIVVKDEDIKDNVGEIIQLESSNFMVCRICLQAESRLFNMTHSSLAAYKRLSKLVDSDDISIPYMLCSECFTLINKFDQFRLKCEQGYTLLRQLGGGGKWDINIVKQMRIENNLQSNLSECYTLNDTYDFHYTFEESRPVTPEPNVVYSDMEETYLEVDFCESDSDQKYDKNEIDRYFNSNEGMEYGVDAKETIDTEHIGSDECSEDVLEKHFRSRNEDNNLQRGDNTHMCDLCGELFVEANLLKNHLFGVHLKNRYPCDKCDKTFKLRQNLQKHKLLHEGHRFQCKECFKTYSSKANRVKHYQNIHVAALRLECDQCPKVFKSKESLTQHIIHVHMKVPWPRKKRKPPNNLTSNNYLYEQFSPGSSSRISTPVHVEPQNAVHVQPLYF